MLIENREFLHAYCLTPHWADWPCRKCGRCEKTCGFAPPTICPFLWSPYGIGTPLYFHPVVSI